jgi:glycolate oxidase
MEKRAFLTRMFASPDIAAFRRIHAALDPKDIANRGKMFPPDDAAAAHGFAAAAAS